MNPLMKFLVPILFIFLGHSSLWGQFGVRAGLTYSKFDNSIESYSEMGPEVAAHYWIRLKNLRIEFYPEVFYGSFNHDEFAFATDFTYGWMEIGLGIPTRVYPFDLKSDCDCPTFSKQNDLFKKGFFLFLDPSVRFSKANNFAYRVNDWSGEPGISRSWSSALALGFGAGLDIGISDLVTISPNLQYRTLISGGGISDDWKTNRLNFSVSATFRPDY